MEKEFVSYEQAVALKELGFDEPCLAAFDKNDMMCSYSKDPFSPLKYNHHGFMNAAPLKQQAFRFFREKYGLYVDILVDKTMEPKFVFEIHHYVKDFEWGLWTMSEYLYRTYEEAEEACLNKLIELGRAIFKERQKQLLTEMIRKDEELGLYNDEIAKESKQ